MKILMSKKQWLRIGKVAGWDTAVMDSHEKTKEKLEEYGIDVRYGTGPNWDNKYYHFELLDKYGGLPMFIDGKTWQELIQMEEDGCFGTYSNWDRIKKVIEECESLEDFSY